MPGIRWETEVYPSAASSSLNSGGTPMIRRNVFIAATIAAVGITACSDTTAPKNDTLVNPSAAEPIVEVTFTKWFTTFPNMTGFTGGDVAGTFAGQVLSLTPFDNGVIVQ